MEVKHEPVSPVVPLHTLPTAPKSILKLKLKAANSGDSSNNNGSSPAAVKKSGRKCVVIDPKIAASDPLFDPRNSAWPVGDGFDGVSPSPSPYGIGNDERDIYCHQTTSAPIQDGEPSPTIPEDIGSVDLNVVGASVGQDLGEHDKQEVDDKMDMSDDDDDGDNKAGVVGIDENVATMTVAEVNENVEEVDLEKERDEQGTAGGVVVGVSLTTPLCEECTTTSTTTRVDAEQPPPVHLKAVVRVSFIGWGEHYDAWIDVDSDRIARFNTKSAGRRGESAVRDEVIYLITHNPTNIEQCMTDKGYGETTPMNTDTGTVATSGEGSDLYATMGMEHQGCFHSQHLVNVVNVFGLGGGFSRIMVILNWARGHIVADPTLIPHPSWKPPSQLCLSLVICVGFLHRVLTPQKRRLLAEESDSDPEYMGFFPCTAFLMRNVGIQELREIAVETFESALCGLEALAIACYSRVESSSSSSSSSSLSGLPTDVHIDPGRRRAGLLVESLWVDVSLRYLSCPYLNRRLGGLKMLSDMLKRAQATIDCPSGLQVTG